MFPKYLNYTHWQYKQKNISNSIFLYRDMIKIAIYYPALHRAQE